MLRLSIIAIVIFLGIYLIYRKLSYGRIVGENEEQVVGKKSGGLFYFIAAVLAGLLFIFVLQRLGLSIGGFLQKLGAFIPLIRAFLPF